MDRNSNRYAVYICPLKDEVRILKMSSSQSSVIALSQNHTTCVLAPYTNSVTQLLCQKYLPANKIQVDFNAIDRGYLSHVLWNISRLRLNMAYQCT